MTSNRSDDSDTSDEDYIPGGQTEELPSEVESDGDPEDDLPAAEENTGKRSKRKQTKKPTKRRKKVTVEEETVVTAEDKTPNADEETEEEKKKKADSLWADFMSDTGFKPRPKPPAAAVETSAKAEPPKKIEPKTVEPPKKVAITQIFEFAGEEVKVTKEVAADSAEARLLSKPSGSTPQPPGKSGVARSRGGLGGISSVLSQLGKKQKISVLEKSKLDWDSFKKDENLEEELQTHNKGKDGYLDRQDFLERADLRRFEIEKEIRTVQRSNRMM